MDSDKVDYSSNVNDKNNSSNDKNDEENKEKSVTKWLHVDIAGPAFAGGRGTGFGGELHPPSLPKKYTHKSVQPYIP